MKSTIADAPTLLPAECQRLLDGNARFVSDQLMHPHHDSLIGARYDLGNGKAQRVP